MKRTITVKVSAPYKSGNYSVEADLAVLVFPEDVYEGCTRWIATALECDLSSSGNTAEEAFERLHAALVGHGAANLKHGRKAPSPYWSRYNQEES